jgi:CDP-4-dehydro-6-deoxyglucose reductase
MEKLAHDVMAVWLKLPSNERLQFLPGQYIDFLLKDGTRRSFSLANTPEEDALLELHIRHVPGGKFTDHVFGAMKVKDIMRISGPYGSFFLRESDKPALLVAGGTGFAPIKSILGHAFHHEVDREFVLYWGAKTLADLYQPRVPSEWQQTRRNFSFIPVLSEPAAGDHWVGRTGYVHAAVLADFEDLSGYEVYACGAPPMVAAARREFMARGLPEDAFFSDSFEFQSAT